MCDQMDTMITIRRQKRGRSDDDEKVLPSAKRMRTVQVNNNQCLQQNVVIKGDRIYGLNEALQSAQINSMQVDNHSMAQQNASSDSGYEVYQPVLSSVQHPVYYGINEVLYYAHLERLQRSHH